MKKFQPGRKHHEKDLYISPCASPLNPFRRLALGRLENIMNHFRAQVYPPKAMANLLPYGFLWTPFCPDLDQAILEPRYTFPKVWQICFHMASFGYQPQLHMLFHCSMPLQNAAVAQAWETSSEVHLSQFTISR